MDHQLSVQVRCWQGTTSSFHLQKPAALGSLVIEKVLWEPWELEAPESCPSSWSLGSSDHGHGTAKTMMRPALS